MTNWKESAKKSIENRAEKSPVTAPLKGQVTTGTDTETKRSSGWRDQAQKSLDKRGYIAPEKRSYELKSADGKSFGTISYGAYNALLTDTTNHYTPKNSEEKKAIDNFKTYADVYSADTISGGLKYYSEIGQYGKGNIDLYNRPQNEDGGISNEQSATFEIDGKYVLLPTVVTDKNGKTKTLSEKEAVEQYKKTGEYLGKFDTSFDADLYAKKLQLAQNFYYGSEYKTTKNGKETKFSVLSPGIVLESGYDDIIYDVINKNKDAVSIQSTHDIGTNATLAGVDKGFLQTMTADEVKVFNYIYSTQGADKAYEFVNKISADLNYRQRVNTEKMWASEAAKDSVKTSIFSTLISPLKAASYVGQVADYIDDGHIDQNAGYNKYSHIPNAIRNEVSSQIENSGKWGTVGSYAYNIGMSMADSLYNTAISGGQQWLSLAIMGTGAAADTTIAAKDRGLSDTQAFWLGAISGAGEIISEKMSFGAIMDADLFTQSVRKYFLKSAAVGGLEEVVADGINFAADTIIAGDKSLWSQSVQSYIQNGKTKGEAVGLTLGNKLLETGLSFVGGAFSTGIMSLGGTVYNTERIREIGKQYNSADDISKVIETGLKKPANSVAYQNALKLQNKIKSGNLGDFEIGQQVLLNEGATITKETTEKSNKAQKLIDKFSSYIHKGKLETTNATADTTVETAIPTADTSSSSDVDHNAEIVNNGENTVSSSTFEDEHAELQNTELPALSVGDVFRNVENGMTLKVIARDENNTTMVVGDNKTPETFSNKQADLIFANEKFEQVESSEAISPKRAQQYNIVVSNLKRKAEELGLLDNKFFTALQNVNLYNLDASDRTLISSEFRRVFASNTDPLVTSWLNAIDADAQPVTSINNENMQVGIEKTSDIDKTDRENSVILDAVNETLYPEAKKDILKIAKKNSVENGIEVFSKKLKIEYEQKRTIDRFSGYFTDEGEKVKAAIKSFYDVKIKKAPTQQTENVQTLSSNVRNASAEVEASDNIISQGNNIVNSSIRNEAENDTHLPAGNTKITVGMSDDVRAELLNKKSVNVVSFDAEKSKTLENIDFDELQQVFKKDAKPIIEKVANDFGILNRSYFNPDIELDFEYSKGSLKESINKQHALYGDFIKMLSVFPDVIKNAVGIETHKDKYVGTVRADTTLKQMYVLASALRDEKGVIPVKLEVKEFDDKINKLYLSVVLTKKESRDLSGNLGQNQLNTAPPTSTISIADLVSVVNPSEGDFLKYFPDSMLDSEQIAAKNKALASDAEKLKKYTAPLKNSSDSGIIKENTDKDNAEAVTTSTEASTDEGNTEISVNKEKGTKVISKYVALRLQGGEKISIDDLVKISNVAFGGSMADNAYTIKDVYDAMELGVNQHILSMENVSSEKMLELLELLPTQTKRTEDMIKYQQFSTPPSIAYLANYAANVNSNDIMLEPSAGIGGIAVFAKKDGATVYVNELDERRLNILKNLPFEGFWNENAEQLDNILGGQIEPTVIVMNPPFSSSSERNIQNTKIGAKHIEQALKILAPGGRLVAIVGHGMEDGAPAFRNWWKDIKSQYNVRANIRINGKNYNKYGTNFDIQMLVIDKNGATNHTETGNVDTLQELQEKLGGIRDERPAIDYSRNEQRIASGTRKETSASGKTADIGNSSVSASGSNADKGKSADNAIIEGQPKRKGVQSADADGGKLTVDESEKANALSDENRGLGTGQPSGSVENGNADGSGDGDSGQSDIQSGRAEQRKRVKHKELTDSIFEHYQTQPLRLKNTRPHPAKVSESAAMSAIEPPAVTYKPNIPQSIVENGVLSDVQLEAISYAGQSHSQTLPDGSTRGFFLGDGTGIGKGRTIAGMMLDNYNQGRKKSLWVTLNSSLVNDAKRDVNALFGNSDLVTQFVGGNKADSVLSADEAIMVISYSALAKGFDNSDSNFEKIVKWLGKDFDGLIVFDEAHKMGNATATKGTRGVKKASQTGLAGIALQAALPKAKIVYSSATGATEVENLRYAERLGLWGDGTAFVTGDDFVSKIKAGGLAAMELIARDMKAMGVYLSRNISYEDVRYDKITHKLTAEQKKIYDELARSWQIVLNNIGKALATTNQSKDGTARGRALGAFWSSQQRFFNQILTSMQVPSVIADIEKQLADGKSCVIQLVSTNEAAQNEEFARLKEEDLELDEFDLTPKQMLMSFIENSFPVQQFEEYRDDDGNVRSKPVYDSQGNPVVNREAVRQREELLTKLGSIKVPSSPIDMIINHFGTDMVAENTGRARRVVQKDGKFIEEKIGSKKDADVDAFQNGNKRIIIFSKAGGTGKSYHADRAAKNQQQRVHYLLEAGWQADNAVQGFGRSHRSNQASAPIFKLVTTNLKGQMRFISTIAKRLDQLGAMTKGQRQAGGQGMFSASDNLENSFAADVLAVFYKDLLANRVDGIENGLAIIEKLGLKDKILDEYNRINVTAPELREVNKFLNRILSLESSEQNTVFDGYSERLQDATEKAMLAGTLDKGLENYKADKITLNEVMDIREDERSGAKTKYYNLTAEHKIKPIRFEDIATESKSFVGFYQNKTTGIVRAVMQTSSTTDQYGNVTNNYKLVGQVKNDYIAQNRFFGNWNKIEASEAEKLWNEEMSKLPEFRKESLHLISGVVLPVWDKLPTENVRIYRVLTSDGEMLIGRVIPEDQIDETLKRLGSSRTKEKIPTNDLITGIKNGDTVYLENDWKIVQRKVSGENRIEIVGPSYAHYDLLTQKGVFTERIQYNTRYFIPANTNTEKITDEILKISPVMRVENAKYAISGSEEGTNEQTGNSLLSGNSGRELDESTREQNAKISSFKQAIKGKARSERQSYAEELLAKELTEEVTDGTHKYNLVKPEGYNEDMQSIVAEAAAKGKEVGFFVGHARRKFDGQKNFLIDGIKLTDTKILLRYDGIYPPQALVRHEEVHTDWNASEVQKVKDIILDGLSDAEKKKLLSVGRYKDYMDLYKNDEEAVWEEFIADALAGMNDYTDYYIDTVADYWYSGEGIDTYSPAVYNSLIDAGGVNEQILENVGLGDDFALSERGDLYGYGEVAQGDELGRIENIRSEKASSRMDEVGYVQQKKANTPHTRILHRSGVSAEVITSSGHTGEQAQISSKSQDNFYSLVKYWYPDLPKNKLEALKRKIKNDIETSNRSITDTANWLFTDIEGTKIFAIYSTENNADPTLLYESKDDRAIAERDILLILLEEIEKDGSSDGKSATINQVFSGGWLRQDSDISHSAGTVGRGRSNRNAGVLPRQSKGKSSRAFRSVLENILEIQGEDRRNSGISERRTGGVKYTLGTYDSDAEELTPEHRAEIHKQWAQDNVDIEKPTKRQLFGEFASYIAHNMTRVFPNIPERGEKGTFFAEFRKYMLQWSKLGDTASVMVQDKLNKMTEGLTPEEFKTFSELVYFLDLQEEAQIQKDKGYTEILLPNEITPSEVDAIVKELEAESTEAVKQALIRRQSIWDDLKNKYIDLNNYIGFDTDGKFKRKNYYHHQVIEYMNDGGKGTGSREIGIKAGRGWLKERHGSTKATNTNFLLVEHKALLQMQYDVYVANMLGKIKDQYDIKPQLEKEAFRNNKNAINELIRKEASDKDGNIVLDSKGNPDSETYRQQKWYNERIMLSFNSLFDLADRGELPTYDGEYSRVVDALKRHDLNAPGLYKYVGIIANATLPDNATDAQEQAVMSAKKVLKYTSQKRAWIKEILADNYQTWETIAKSMRDTHTIHQPRRGNYFFSKEVLDEDAFNKAQNEMVVSLASGEIDLGSKEVNEVFVRYSDTVRLMGVAYEQWVLPNEIVTTMNEIANPKQTAEAAKAARYIISLWKGWATSVNPLRTVKFGLRNMAGDLDAVIAGKPQIVMYSKKAVEDIYQAMRHKKYSTDFMEWVERGGYTSMLFANEMDSEMQDKLFSHLKDKQGINIFKIPKNLIDGYRNGVENVHNFREAILRYSAYLYFKEAIKRNNGTVKDYVASNRYIVRGLNTAEDKAYQLSKDLLGAYDEVGKMGQTLRRYWIPFYSFNETNLKRYYRMFENIIASDDKIPKKAGKLLLKILKANMLGLLMVAWNRLVMKDEDDKLPPSVRNVPHITLGQLGDDVYAFRQLGSFSELLEWIGLDDYKWTAEDLTAPLDKAWGMITPFFKMPIELVSGLNFYPSLTEPSAIRDKWQHFFNSLGVDDIYSELAGKPTKGWGEAVKGAFVYNYDYKESAYYEILDIKRRYQGDTDNTIYGVDKKSNALYYMKKAVRYKDKEAALKYLDQYFENGGTAGGIKKSFTMLNPMYGFTGKDTAEKGVAFIASLTEDQKEKLKIAQDYYESDLMLPENVLELLGKKDITDEEAKNVLKNYIKAKCK